MKNTKLLVVCSALFVAATFICSKTLQTETSDLLLANIEALAQSGESDEWLYGSTEGEIGIDTGQSIIYVRCCVKASQYDACNFGQIRCAEFAH